jgi:hypothetical protein
MFPLLRRPIVERAGKLGGQERLPAALFDLDLVTVREFTISLLTVIEYFQ